MLDSSVVLVSESLFDSDSNKSSQSWVGYKFRTFGQAVRCPFSTVSEKRYYNEVTPFYRYHRLLTVADVCLSSYAGVRLNHISRYISPSEIKRTLRSSIKWMRLQTLDRILYPQMARLRFKNHKHLWRSRQLYVNITRVTSVCTLLPTTDVTHSGRRSVFQRKRLKYATSLAQKSANGCDWQTRPN